MLFGPGPGGPPDMFTMPVPPPGFGGPGDIHFKWRRGARRIRRGDVRAAILLLLEEQPRNGYQVMQELESRSEGLWRPSPGSVYPALQLLADEGLIREHEGSGEGGNVFELTDAGKSHVGEHRERLGEPWKQVGEGMPEGLRELGGLLAQVAAATRQVMHAGTEPQVAAAGKLLAETRRSLYRILADDETAPANTAPGEESP
jgi:DNA-binding PadR family transcriptional regulator